jgi:hypothetical protein
MDALIGDNVETTNSEKSTDMTTQIIGDENNFSSEDNIIDDLSDEDDTDSDDTEEILNYSN